MKFGKKEDDNDAFKATIWYLICDFFTRGIAFVTMPIFTRMMTVSEIGSYTILTSWISIFSVVITLNLVQSVFLAKFDYKNDYDGFVSTVSTLGLLSALVCYVVVLPFRGEVAQLLCIDKYAVDVMAVHLMFCQMSAVLLAKYRAEFEYKKSVFLTVGTTIVITISAVLCTVMFDDSLKGRIYGTYAPAIILNVCLYIFVLYRRGSFKKEYCQYALAISIPLIVHNLAGNLMHSSDRVIIGKICSQEDVGVYGVAYTCAMFANVLRNSMIAAWNPWVFENLSRNNIEKIKTGSYPYLIVFFVLCMVIVLLAPEMLYILGGESYVLAKYVVPPVVTAYMFSMVYSLYAGIEQYYKKQKYFALFAVICAVFNIVLNYIFIPIYGYIAAAYTTVAGTALECLLHYLNVRKMKLSYVYSGRFNVFMIVAMIGISLGTVVLYSNDIARYGFILCILVIFFAMSVRYNGMIKRFILTKKKGANCI